METGFRLQKTLTHRKLFIQQQARDRKLPYAHFDCIHTVMSQNLLDSHDFTIPVRSNNGNQALNSGLHIVVTIAEHACDHVLRLRVLKLSANRFQIFLVKYEYVQSLQPCEDQDISGKLKKRVREHVLAILTTYMATRLKGSSMHVLCKEVKSSFTMLYFTMLDLHLSIAIDPYLHTSTRQGLHSDKFRCYE